MKKLFSVYLALLLIFAAPVKAQNPQSGSVTPTNAAPVSPGMWVTTNDVIFANISGDNINAVAMNLVARFQSPNGTIQTTGANATCTTASVMGQCNNIPFIQAPFNGWLTYLDGNIQPGGVGTAQTSWNIFLGQQTTNCNPTSSCSGSGSFAVANFTVQTVNTIIVLKNANLSSFQHLCWPADCKSVQDGQGAIHSYTIANPSAGANVSITPPYASLARTQLISFQVTLTTNATAGNRFVGIQGFCQGGTNQWGSWFSSVAQTASTTVTYTFNPGAQQSATGNPFQTVALPSMGIIFDANDPCGTSGTGGLSVVVNGITAGDQLSALVGRTLIWEANN